MEKYKSKMKSNSFFVMRPVEESYINYLPVVKKGGFIGGHDYTGNWPQVVKAVNDVLVKVDYTFADGSWVKEII